MTVGYFAWGFFAGYVIRALISAGKEIAQARRDARAKIAQALELHRGAQMISTPMADGYTPPSASLNPDATIRALDRERRS